MELQDLNRRSSFIRFSVILLLLTLLPACKGGSNPNGMLAGATDNNVKRVSRMYTVFQMRHGMIGPKDEVELKEFILSHSAARLARIGIDPASIDGIFSSERDGEKLIIRYGTELEGSNTCIPVVFEAEGKNGIRFVGFANAYVTEVSDEEEYDRLMSGAEDNRAVDDNPA